MTFAKASLHLIKSEMFRISAMHILSSITVDYINLSMSTYYIDSDRIQIRTTNDSIIIIIIKNHITKRELSLMWSLPCRHWTRTPYGGFRTVPVEYFNYGFTVITYAIVSTTEMNTNIGPFNIVTITLSIIDFLQWKSSNLWSDTIIWLGINVKYGKIFGKSRNLSTY